MSDTDLDQLYYRLIRAFLEVEKIARCIDVKNGFKRRTIQDLSWARDAVIKEILTKSEVTFIGMEDALSEETESEVVETDITENISNELISAAGLVFTQVQNLLQHVEELPDGSLLVMYDYKLQEIGEASIIDGLPTKDANKLMLHLYLEKQIQNLYSAVNIISQ